MGQAIQVQLGCVLQPNEAMTALVFACEPGAPVVPAGMHAVMFLRTGAGSSWDSGLGTEVLPVVHGVIRPQDPSVGVEKQASGVSATALLTTLRAAANAG